MSTKHHSPLGLRLLSDSPTQINRNLRPSVSNLQLDYNRIYCISIALHRSKSTLELLHNNGNSDLKTNPNARHAEIVAYDLLQLGWTSRAILYRYRNNLATCMRVTYYNPDIVVRKAVLE